MPKPEGSHNQKLDTVKFNAIWLPVNNDLTAELNERGFDADAKHVLWSAGSTEEAFMLRAHYLELAYSRIMRDPAFPSYQEYQIIPPDALDVFPPAIKTATIAHKSPVIMVDGSIDIVGGMPEDTFRGTFIFGKNRKATDYQYNGAMHMWLRTKNQLLTKIGHPPIPPLNNSHFGK